MSADPNGVFATRLVAAPTLAPSTFSCADHLDFFFGLLTLLDPLAPMVSPNLLAYAALRRPGLLLGFCLLWVPGFFCSAVGSSLRRSLRFEN